MAAKFEAVDPGHYRVAGPMTFKTVADLLHQSGGRFLHGERAKVDLSQVGDSDSAVLAILIEWKRLARRNNGTVTFANMPPQLTSLARISEVDELLSDNAAAERTAESATLA